jgi:hypothetical protein
MIKRIANTYSWVIDENGEAHVGARFTMKIINGKYLVN